MTILYVGKQTPVGVQIVGCFRKNTIVVLVAIAAAVIRCLYPKVQPKAELRLREIVSLLIDLAIQFMMAEMIARTAVAIK